MAGYTPPSSPGTLGTRKPTAATDAFSTGVTGDTADRFVIDADGSLRWGPGNAALDVVMQRVGADFVKIFDKFFVAKTDSVAFRVADDASLVKLTVDTVGDLIKLASGVDFDFGGAGAAGCRIGQGVDKLAFYGKAPVGQQGAVGPPAGGAIIDVEARAAINAIINVIGTVGLTT